MQSHKSPPTYPSLPQLHLCRVRFSILGQSIDNSLSPDLCMVRPAPFSLNRPLRIFSSCPTPTHRTMSNTYIGQRRVIFSHKIPSHLSSPPHPKHSFHESFCSSFPLKNVQIRFSAFDESFNLRLSPVSDFINSDTRVRALGAGGVLMSDRAPRLCAYGGRLPHGGWVRAVVRSLDSVTVHFLHKVLLDDS